METILTPLTPMTTIKPSVSYCQPSGSTCPSEDCMHTLHTPQSPKPDQRFIVSPTPSASPTLSTTSSNSSTLPQVSDEELACLSVRQLNQRLQGQDRQIVSALKQKRRTLKNRGYAFNCRVRRIQNQLQLEADNVMLKDQVRYLKQLLENLEARLAYYEPIGAVSINPPPPPQQQQSPAVFYSQQYTYQ